MQSVYLIDGCRTPIGSLGGMFKDLSPSQLGVSAAQDAIRRAGVPKEELDEVIVGNCLMETSEANLARVISLASGVPFSVPAFTVQRQCSSGMQALVCGAQQIQTGENNLVLVGGVEAMSHAPYNLSQARYGYRLKGGELADSVWQVLTDPVTEMIMGMTAENLAAKYDISREDQDEVAYTSHQRAAAAFREGRWQEEIHPVEVLGRRGKTDTYSDDEHIRHGVSLGDFSKLKPVFKKDGTVTAGNASGINDGAAFAVLASESKVKELGLKPLARLVGHATAGVEPELMGYGPVPATKKAMQRAGWNLQDLDLIELNEAFAAQYLACERLLELDRDKTNVNGSGIALGHPIRCTGVRIIISLLYEMRRRNLKKGLASLCVGGGMGKSTLWEMT